MGTEQLAATATSRVTVQDLGSQQTYVVDAAESAAGAPEWLGDLATLSERLVGKRVDELVGVTFVGGGRYLKITAIA